MARPIISPMSVSATTPETVVVLDQRMRVVEEQTNALLRDLEKLGVNGDSMELFPSKPLENWDGHRSISPVHARVAFVGKNDTLWRTCETLVNRMCRLESVVQTLKLNMFRLQTEKELNPKHAANLEQRLNTIQEEHIQELKVLQTEGRTLYQQLSESREEEGKARDQVQRLSAALEIATAAKLKEHLSKERSMRETLEESQAVLLYRMQDMEVTVEKERKQVHILQQDSSSLRQDIQIIQEKLLKEEERTVQLEQECIQLKADLESRETTISRLSEEGKAVQVSFSKEHEENLQLRSEITALRDVAEKVQVLNEQLDQQCAELNGTLQSVTMEKAKLISDHQAALKAEQDKISQKLQEQDLLLDAARASIMEELQIVQNEKARLQREIEALHAEHADCKQRACQVEESTATQKELLESTVARLRSELEAALQEKDSLLKEKEKLGEEMQKTIHERTQENNKLEAELTEKKLEIDPLKDTLKILEEENKNLLEREAAMKHQQHAQQQVDQVLAELTDNKNKLAYEKGKLQVRVQQLEEDVQSLADAHSENSQLRKRYTALETKYNQANTELASVRISMQRMEAQLKQTQSVLVCTEEEFSNAVQSRDEALKENQKIKGQISAIEERGKHKVATLRRKVEEAKQDNFKMTTMLENVLASHNKMQVALEKVQTELGRKDSEIAGLRKDRTQFQQRIQKLEEELEHCHSKLVLETQHSMKIDPLRKALECSKADNKKLLQNLEQTRQTNSVLQSKLILVQDELESKEAEYQQLLECRDQLIEESKLEAKLYGERIETLKKQFQTEREAAKKAAHKESSELKKALEEACSKSSEMSRSNRELRAKVTELDEALASQKAKLKRQKAVIARYFNSKADNAERIKEIESELRQMEEMKQQYQKKNYEQSLSIKEFVSELTSLQSEMQELAKNQQEVAKENQNLESQLEAERKQRKQLVEHCQTLEDTVRHLKKCKEDTEQKLKEASVESEQISANLEEAHRWFKSKFENLQHELAKRRPLEIPCEQDDKEEKPVKLPSQACLKRWETKHHLKFVSKKYLNELKK
ncbi:coiled-coil domain-containing protein 150 isoform X2 [Hemicordylus capensis]|uniref:coiled-coil domain-containing protein 150 isoform X2 n=1 Tax=Hemicordylus capensis TaxID=884348 RepID=UPI002304305C|nr:coiled-coil domain-containing protein 150 isoform X2 [Hemicordylus capensis]